MIQFKFSDIVQRTTLRLAQVYGGAVQVYSEDIIGEMVQHKFDTLFEERWWANYSYWRTSKLTDQGYVEDVLDDTSQGAPPPVNRNTDIRSIFYDTDTRPLPMLEQNTNPYNYINASGRSRPIKFMWDTSIGGKYFRVLPFGDEKNVHINYRSRPQPFNADDYINLDDHLLILGSAYDYAEDDGTNPGATAKLLALFEARYEQVLGSENEAAIPINSGWYHTRPDTPWGVGDHTA